MDRARWRWWLAAAPAAVLLAVWWQPWANSTGVAAPVAASTATPAAAPAIAKRISVVDLHSPALTPTQVAMHEPELHLVGTAVGGGSNLATVRRGSDAQLLLLRVGDKVDGLAVSSIERNRIVLTGATQAIVIEADRMAAVTATPVTSSASSARATAQPETPAFPEGEAPWDAGPNFRH